MEVVAVVAVMKYVGAVEMRVRTEEKRQGVGDG
jgi:hypothetical protein